MPYAGTGRRLAPGSARTHRFSLSACPQASRPPICRELCAKSRPAQVSTQQPALRYAHTIRRGLIQGAKHRPWLFPARVYQISFSPNWIWRDVVVVEVRTPAEEIGAPLAPNRLVLLVVTTGEAKFVWFNS